MAENEDWIEEAISGDVEDDGNSEIQNLLDLGYEQLDRFVAWLEEALEIDTRGAQQDVYNAEALVDYLANYGRKSAVEINEFELRWFLFSHYIRKSVADSETELRLPDSVRRFYEFLRTEDAYDVPDWLYFVLDDRAYYEERLKAYADLDEEDERRWQRGFTEWCADLEVHLDSRSLWMPREISGSDMWGDLMGWREAALYEEANRLWQERRAELLGEGLDVEAVRERLISEHTLWMETPQDRLDGETPIGVIQEERQEAAAHRSDQADDQEEDRE